MCPGRPLLPFASLLTQRQERGGGRLAVESIRGMFILHLVASPDLSPRSLSVSVCFLLLSVSDVVFEGLLRTWSSANG